MKRFALVMMLLISLVSSGLGDDSQRPPNFVIIMADDLGYGDLSCYDGWIQTPHLDRLSREGLRLTDFHSNGSVCSPTRAALITGRYQQRVGIPRVIVAKTDAAEHRNGLRKSERTFAEAFAKHGYATGIFGKWHLGYYPQFNPIQHGFQIFRGYVSGNVDFFSHIDQVGNADWWHNDQKVDEDGYVTHLITQHAVTFIEQNHAHPFCLYVPHEAPHYPYQGPNDSADRTVGGKFPNHGSRSDKKEAYREMVVEMDRGIGEILAALRRHGLDRNTFIFFCSDNGATRLGSNGSLRGHKGSVWEGGHRVPAIAWWPDRIKAGVSSTPAMTMDLMPTLLTLAGIEATPEDNAFDGIDLSAHWLTRQLLEPRTLFWGTDKAQAVRRGNWKLVKSQPAGSQLFRLDTDLAESQDLSPQHPERAATLQRALENWSKEVNAASLGR